MASPYVGTAQTEVSVYERRFIKILDIIIKDNIRINDRVVPSLLKKLEVVVVEKRKEEEEEREARAEQMNRTPASEKNRRFVSEKEIQKESQVLPNLKNSRQQEACVLSAS